MSQAVDIGTLIDRDPRIRGGRPLIAGTGVTVERIVRWYRAGLEPREIAAKFGHLSVGQVFAALAYWQANREEIDTDIETDDARAEELERKARGARSS
ncbi:MAG: DUF433 domain-containing protein [Planctomycetes bacterium]|nr:DUF433 domain-containing protein [Planctomycetota bacterium]